MLLRKTLRTGARRAFSSFGALQKNGAVPKFNVISSPESDNALSLELEKTLNEYRAKVFLPNHLTTEQRLLISRAHNKKLLEEDPVKVQIDGETFTLQHIPVEARLGRHPGLRKLVKLMQTKQDWANLIPWLTGYHTSCKLGRNLKSYITQQALRAGRLDVLLECARQADSTGFTLDDPAIVVDMAWHAQNTACVGEWEANVTAKALRNLENLALMLEDERHVGGYKIREEDPRVRPELIGILLQLSSVMAGYKFDGKDTNGAVRKYAERLRAVMEAGHQINHESVIKKRVKNRTQYEVFGGKDNSFLCRAAPVIHGLRIAQMVLDPASSLSNWCKAQEQALMVEVESAREKVLEIWHQHMQKKLLAEEDESARKELLTTIETGPTTLQGICCYNALLNPDAKEGDEDLESAAQSG